MISHEQLGLINKKVEEIGKLRAKIATLRGQTYGVSVHLCQHDPDDSVSFDGDASKKIIDFIVIGINSLINDLVADLRNLGVEYKVDAD